MKTMQAEVVIIGSGFGAAPPALRFSSAGFKTLVLEKGPDISPSKDLKQSQDPRYIMRYLKGISNDHLDLTYAEGVGGASAFYEMVSLRAPGRVFEAVNEAGESLWPNGLTRKVLDPYYDIGEQMLGVRQLAVNEVPKSGLAFAWLMKNANMSADRARYAVKKSCVGSSHCLTGCLYGAKQSLHYNYIPSAKKAGAEYYSDMEVESIEPMGWLPNESDPLVISRLPYLYRIHATHTGSGELFEIHTKLVFLAGGTIGTPSVLLRSKHLDKLSNEVGRGLSFNGCVKQLALLPDDCPDGDMFAGLSHPGMVSYEFMDSHGIMVTTGKATPLQLFAQVRITEPGAEDDFWGGSHLALMKKYRHRMIIFVAFGFSPPAADVRLSGKNELKLRMTNQRRIKEYHADMNGKVRSLLEHLGCKPLNTQYLDGVGRPRSGYFFGTAHQLGSCKMSSQPSRGVVNGNGEVFGYPGMFISDGSTIPTSTIVNPSLTILANAERITAQALKRTGQESMLPHADRIAAELRP